MYTYVAKGFMRQKPSPAAKDNQVAVSDINTCHRLVGLEVGQFKCKIYTRFQKLRKRNVIISVLFILCWLHVEIMLHVDVWGSIKYII